MQEEKSTLNVDQEALELASIDTVQLVSSYSKLKQSNWELKDIILLQHEFFTLYFEN